MSMSKAIGNKRKQHTEENDDNELPRKLVKHETNNNNENNVFCSPIVWNVKVNKIRPEYKNLHDWMSDPNNVYIGRGGVIFIDRKRFPGKASIWANPFKIGRDGKREAVMTKFEQYLRDLLEKNPSMKDELLKLQGKNIGCWCVDSPTKECDDDSKLVCHGQLLIRIMKEIYDEKHRNDNN